MSIDIDRMEAMARHGAAATPDAALALIARIRELSRELEQERYHRRAAEDSEQALAAHVGRQTRVVLDTLAAIEDGAPSAIPYDEARALYSDAPTTSLARLIAEKRAEVMLEALDVLEYMDSGVGNDRGALDATRDELRDKAAEYRHQAEQADTAEGGAHE